MTIMVDQGGGGDSFEQLSPGNYQATCYKIVDVGTSMEEFKGEVNKRTSLYLFFETPDVKTSNGQPMSIFNKYTKSLNEKSKLRQHLQQWRSRPFTDEELSGFDMQNILGVSCTIEVVDNANGNAKVKGVYAAEGGSKKTPTHNDCVVFDLEEYCKEFSGESSAQSKKMCDVFEELPRFMKSAIIGDEDEGKKACFEYLDAVEKGQGQIVEDKPKPKADEPFVDDDIPF
jgi:hypothetical protein